MRSTCNKRRLIINLDKKSSLLLLSNRCYVTISVLWLFLPYPWLGLQCVIVVFPDHTHLHFGTKRNLADLIFLPWFISALLKG